MYDPKDHLKRLVETHAPSGYEAPVAALLREEWAGLVDEFDSDGLGSLIGIKRGTRASENRRKIMLAAHMDEIGLMVRQIEDGFIYVHRVSGIDPRVMLAQPVLVHGERALPGVVATMPPHMLTAAERQQFKPIDELVVDVGLPAEEVERLVRIGDLVTVEGPMIDLKGRQVASKAMDDRCCVAVMTTCLERLRKMNHSWDVMAVATVQEEVGLRGAATAANHIEPDCAIALDVGFAEQPGLSTAPSSGHPITINGSFPFVNIVTEALDALRDRAPQWYAYVTTNLYQVNEGSSSSHGNGQAGVCGLRSYSTVPYGVHEWNVYSYVSSLVHYACHSAYDYAGLPYNGYTKVNEEADCVSKDNAAVDLVAAHHPPGTFGTVVGLSHCDGDLTNSPHCRWARANCEWGPNMTLLACPAAGLVTVTSE